MLRETGGRAVALEIPFLHDIRASLRIARGPGALPAVNTRIPR